MGPNILSPDAGVPILQVSVLSSNTNLAFGAVPRSISIPACPSVTPAPVSFLLSTIMLSSIAKFVVSIVVSVPFTSRFPFTVRLPPIVALLFTTRVPVVVVPVTFTLPPKDPLFVTLIELLTFTLAAKVTSLLL